MLLPRWSPLALSAILAVSTLARPGGTQGPPTPHPAVDEGGGVAPAPNGLALGPPRPSVGLDPALIDDSIQKLAAEVQRWGGTVGVHVVDVATGATVAALDERRALNPASNAKLWTAAAALRVLGGQHRFLTGLYGRIDGDAVDELVLRGDGDPSLRTADLWAMAGELRALGVRRVRAVLVDQSLFDERYVPPAFDQQPGEWAPFRAPVAAVSLNENTVLFTVRALKEGGDAVVAVDPPGFVDVVGAVITTRSGDPEKVSVVIEPRGTRLAGRLSGNLPEGGRLVRVARRVDDPRLLAGYALRAVLRQVGVEVRGEVRLGGTGQNELLVSHHSQSVGGLLWALGKESDNFYAEMIFKAIGARARGRPGSADAGAEAVRRAIEDAGVGDPSLVVKNGSGLFDADRATPAGTTGLLRTMVRDASVAPEYLAHLSIGGVDGTLRHRFREWESTRAVRAKTGTLDAVTALSGYVLAPPGRSAVAFSILVNGIPGKVTPARALIDRVVDAIAREVWKGVLNPPSATAP
jgi:D-alanyl-D-alanine carboxypeptidase/D-alanyl-D-alanine-endopeptidase (penicillin-binding protein 4)